MNVSPVKTDDKFILFSISETGSFKSKAYDSCESYAESIIPKVRKVTAVEMLTGKRQKNYKCDIL